MNWPFELTIMGESCFWIDAAGLLNAGTPNECALYEIERTGKRYWVDAQGNTEPAESPHD